MRVTMRAFGQPSTDHGRFMTLSPGDILTSSPKRGRYAEPGDEVVMGIEQIGAFMKAIISDPDSRHESIEQHVRCQCIRAIKI